MSGLDVAAGGVGPPCDECPVRRWRIFKPFEDKELAFVHNMLVVQRTIASGTDIVSAGERGGPLYTLWRGWGYRYKPVGGGPSGRAPRRQIIDFVLPGDLIGLESALTGEVCHSVRALTEVVVCLHDPKLFLHLFEECHRLARAVLETVVRDYRRTDTHLAVLGRKSATQQLAHVFLDLSDRMAQRDMVGIDDTRFPFPLRRRHLADTLGISGTHVARSVDELRAAALIELADGFLMIRDRERLANLAGYRSLADGMGRRAIL